MGNIEIVEAGGAYLDPGILRIIIKINDRVFKRLYERGLSVCWMDNATGNSIEKEEAKELESIFKAWCLENHGPAYQKWLDDTNEAKKLLKRRSRQ